MTTELAEATDPQTGVVHIVSGDTAMCGKTGAASWSRAQTAPMQAGLVLRCQDCLPSFMRQP